MIQRGRGTTGDGSACSQPAPLGFSPPENLAHQADRDQYELLCLDNTRKPVDKYEECYLAQVPSHAVVARSVGGKEDLIWELLNQAQVPPSTTLSSCCEGLGGGVPLLEFGVFSFLL